MHHYILRDGAGRGAGGFDAVGTDCEAPPLTSDQTLSYDEMALAALLGRGVIENKHSTGVESMNRVRASESAFTSIARR